MAEASLSRTIERDFLTCQICMEIFSSPKMLPCVHTFCSGCAEQLIVTATTSRGKTRFSITCPTCRAVTNVANGHVNSLKTNFYIDSLVDVFKATHSTKDSCSICKVVKKTDVQAHSKCIDCDDFLCKSCSDMHTFTRQTIHHRVVALDELSSGAFDQQIRLAHGVHCKEHKDEVVKFVCKTCAIPVCRDCIMINHRQHDVLRDGEAVNIMRPKLDDLIKQINQKFSEYQEKETKSACDLENIGKEENTAINTVYGVTADLMNRISAEGEAAVGLLTQPFATAKKSVSEARDQFLWKLEVVNETKKFINNVIDTGNATEILSLYTFINDRLEQLYNIDALSADANSAAIKYPILRKSKQVANDKLDLFHVDIEARGLNDPFVVWAKSGVDEGNMDGPDKETYNQRQINTSYSAEVVDRGCQTEETNNDPLSPPANGNSPSKNILNMSPANASNLNVTYSRNGLPENADLIRPVSETENADLVTTTKLSNVDHEPSDTDKETTDTTSSTDTIDDTFTPGTMLNETYHSDTNATVSDNAVVLTDGAKRCILEFSVIIVLAVLFYNMLP